MIYANGKERVTEVSAPSPATMQRSSASGSEEKDRSPTAISQRMVIGFRTFLDAYVERYRDAQGDDYTSIPVDDRWDAPLATTKCGTCGLTLSDAARLQCATCAF